MKPEEKICGKCANFTPINITRSYGTDASGMCLWKHGGFRKAKDVCFINKFILKIIEEPIKEFGEVNAN